MKEILYILGIILCASCSYLFFDTIYGWIRYKDFRWTDLITQLLRIIGFICGVAIINF